MHTDAAAHRTHLPLVALFAANIVSLTGNMVTWVAVPWLVLETTGSATRTGLVGAVIGVATVGAGIFGGPFVDRVGHKRTSILADILSGVTVLLIPVLFHTTGLAFWQLLALVFLGAVLDAPGNAARQALLPDVAQLSGMPLERANSIYEGIVYGAELAGPLAGGFLIALVGADDALLVDAATFAVSATLLGLLVPAGTSPISLRDRPSTPDSSRTARPAAAAIRRYVGDIATGLRFIARQPLLRTLVTASALTNFIGASLFTVVLLTYARETWGADGAARFGTIFAAGGAGLVAGTIAYAVLGRWLPRRPTFLVSFACFGLTLWPLALTPPFALIVAIFLVRGFLTGPYNPLLTTIIQEIVPAGLRGRIFGARSALSQALLPLGFVAGGFLTDATGVTTTLLVMAAGYGIATLWLTLTPATRELRPPDQ